MNRLVAGTAAALALLATNAVGAQAADTCPNAAFRVGPSAALPDCRAYEMVSPSDKNGGIVDGVVATSADGRAISWFSSEAYAGAQGIAQGNVSYVGRRGPDGWTVTPFAPRFGGPDATPTDHAAPGLIVFDADLTKMLFVSNASFDTSDQDWVPGAFFELGTQDLFLLGASGDLSWISRASSLPSTAVAPVNEAGNSADFSTFFFETAEPMTDQVPAATTTRQLYRWRDGRVDAVGLDPSGAVLTVGTRLGSATSFGEYIGGQIGAASDSVAVSRDGSRFVFCAAGPVGGFGNNDPGALYLHRDGLPSLEISRSQRTGSVGVPAPSGARFIDAKQDVSIIYFYSDDQLTDDAPSDGGDYRYDVSTGKLSYSNPDGDQQGGTGGLVKISDDGERIYFVSDQVLAPGATAGQPNMYFQGRGGARVHVATLKPGADLANWMSAGGAGLRYTSTQISADGERLLFISTNSPTSYQSDGHSEIYEYRASTSVVTCISCRPSGAAPSGDATLTPPTILSGASPAPRGVTADWSRIVFTTTDALVPEDGNGVSDVYEYHDGTVSLISTGNSPRPSLLDGMSPDGADIYVRTSETLTASDGDRGLTDIYDARLGGGLPSPRSSSPCSGDGCQTAPATTSPGEPLATTRDVAPRQVTAGSGVVKVDVTSARRVLTLRVVTQQAGRISVSGKGVRTMHRTAVKAGSYAMRIGLTASAAKSLRARRSVRLRVRVGFAGRSGTSSSKTLSVTLKA